MVVHSIMVTMWISLFCFPDKIQFPRLQDWMQNQHMSQEDAVWISLFCFLEKIQFPKLLNWIQNRHSHVDANTHVAGRQWETGPAWRASHSSALSSNRADSREKVARDEGETRCTLVSSKCQGESETSDSVHQPAARVGAMSVVLSWGG